MTRIAKHSSDHLATLASYMLRQAEASKETKSLAASVLSQARGVKKK